MSHWLKAISQHILKKPDPVPKGWKTASQIRKELGLSQSRTREIIVELKAKKLVDSQVFYIKSNDYEVCHPVKHYKLKGK